VLAKEYRQIMKLSSLETFVSLLQPYGFNTVV
jgi:hypothetical protein